MVRCIVMWAAGVVLGLSVAAWVVSLWGVQWEMSRTKGPAIWFLWGEVQAFSTKPIRSPGWHTNGLEWPSRNTPYWRHMLGISRLPEGRFVVWLHFPLWMPAALSGGLHIGPWVQGVRQKRRAMVGSCPHCNYDRTGITGVCPECGSEKEERQT